MAIKTVTLYLHGTEEDYYDDAQRLGIKSESEEERNFANWAYELKFEVEVDTKTGDTKILSVDDKRVTD